MVNCASASGYAFGFSLLDILLLLSPLWVLLNREREREKKNSIWSAQQRKESPLERKNE